MKINLPKSNNIIFALVLSLFLQYTKAQCTFGNFPTTYTTPSSFGKDYLLGTNYSLITTGTLTALGYKGNGTGSAMQMAIYTDAAGLVGTLVAVTATTTNGTGVINIPVITPTVIPAGKYWVMAIYQLNSLNEVCYTTSATNTVSYIALPFGSAPPTSASWTTYTGQDFNYWATIQGTPPTVSVSSSTTTICSGSPVSLTASGAITYAWNTGATTTTINPTPTLTTTYSVIGTNSVGCFGTATQVINVNALPSIVITGTNIVCSGTPLTLTAGGSAITYSWNTGAVAPTISVTPLVNTTYTVTGIDGNGCVNSAVKSITVNALPILSTISTNSILCVGQSATLTAGGAFTYSWSTGSTSVSIVVSPTVTSNYTVTGVSALGCIGTAVKTQSVSACVGIASLQNANTEFKAYPNPTNGKLTIELLSETSITIYNSIGEIIFSEKLQQSNYDINLSEQANGIYMIKANNGHSASTIKIIKN